MTLVVSTGTASKHPENSCRVGPQGATSIPSRVHTMSASSISPSLHPLSYPYRDLQGRVIQLWKWREHLIASITSPDGTVFTCSGPKIHNALQPCETGDTLLHRIDAIGLRMWQIGIIENRDLYVWPLLEAAGRGSPFEVAEAQVKLDNIQKHLKKDVGDKTHIGACARESRGEVVAWKDNGTTYDHRTEVAGYRNSCQHALFGARRELQRLDEKSRQPEYRSAAKQQEIEVERKAVTKVYSDAKQLLSRLKSREYPLTRIYEKGREPTRTRDSKLPTLSRVRYDKEVKNPRNPGPIGAHVTSVKDRVDKDRQAEKPKEPPPGGGGEKPDCSRRKPPGLLGGRSFKEIVQQNRLVGSYNACNPKHPIAQRGASGGSIGGIGNQVGIIEGLFSSIQDMGETCHYFYIPSTDGKLPFSNDELRQLLRELAVGIYVHDTVPFFSLHFRADGIMYPVIHPAYQNTLVGRVISLLDYYMKGFLNGGFFDETFLKEWQTTKSQDKEFLRSRCIDLRAYCREHLLKDCEYFSIKELIQKAEIEGELEEGLSGDEETESAKTEPAIFSQYSGFRSSFRIIAKQNSFKKEGRLFELDGGFDVLYTIEPDPVYAAELEKFRAHCGRNPVGYGRLVKAYDTMKRQIETLMQRLPIFHELFEQLKVINFFTYYFKTLKQAQKVPVLGQSAKNDAHYCVPLFPHLPIRTCKDERFQLEFRDIYNKLSPEDRGRFLTRLTKGGVAAKVASEVSDIIGVHLKKYLQDKMSFPLSEEKIDVQARNTRVTLYLAHRISNTDRIVRCRRVTKDIVKMDLSDVQEEYQPLKKEEVDLTELQKNLQCSLDGNYSGASLLGPILSLIFGRAWRKSKERAENRLVELRKELTVLADKWRKLDERLKEIKSAKQYPLEYVVKSTEIPLRECCSTLLMSPEYSLQDREYDQRIVGGCGLDLQNRSLTFFPDGVKTLEHIYPDLQSASEEEFVPVKIGDRVEGYAFSLDFADCPAAEDSEYVWMTHLLSDEEQESLQAQDQVFRLIAQEKIDEFDALITPKLLSCKDVSGATLVHAAASVNDLSFLKKLDLLKADFHAVDQDGFTPLHYAARAGVMEATVFLLEQCPNLLHSMAKNNASPLFVAISTLQNFSNFAVKF